MVFRLLRRSNQWQRLGGNLVISIERSKSFGYAPVVNTLDALTAMTSTARSHETKMGYSHVISSPSSAAEIACTRYSIADGPLTLKMIWRLHEGLGIPAESLIKKRAA
jgi:hypothetical protein